MIPGGFERYLRRVDAALFAAVAATAISAATVGPSAHAEDKPYKIEKDGTVDWSTFSGYRRYHSECHVCHGPDALGSSFAPALANSLKTMTYDQFIDVVVNGRKNVSASSDKVMPSFGTNRNVMCFINDIYAYLKARADGVLPRGRPKHEPKPKAAQEAEDACMG
ncbi:c-type cytochrome, methanol metabolism-related [Tistlia consotensis]|uniref:C-type cytochrome, methanol metabolism-related n=2 Tax=Tistlia TaxID=1321364 RepID=A0A1Y6CNN7_9PROT|nr:c-type cytochrome, methanol metabolism-related [Tistlia consotensis USBA 355]SNR62352.1 c-type cytochrome, methanol metabolism-related [Tistlia consotensis]